MSGDLQRGHAKRRMRLYDESLRRQRRRVRGCGAPAKCFADFGVDAFAERTEGEPATEQNCAQ
jgi:hypothetical protein